MVNNIRETSVLKPDLRLVAWELTGRCNLYCAHCRGSAGNDACDDDMSLDEAKGVVDAIAKVGRPMLILTGGEPLLRPDIFDIAHYAHQAGLKVVLGSNGTLITDDIASKIREAHISRVAVSLDFPSVEEEDRFRGKKGAFEAAMSGIAALNRAGVGVQINTTVSRLNVSRLGEILSLAIDCEAVAFHPFFLVPTGRGRGLADQELEAFEYEEVLNWICDQEQTLRGRILFKPTDAPHYYRIVTERQGPGWRRGFSSNNTTHTSGRGCLCGVNFCFISHTGEVKGCGYLDLVAGRLQDQSFASIWHEAPLFKNLRNLSLLQGKCGRCEYKLICGGCRARAYELTGDYMASEPYCVYQPKAIKRIESGYGG